MKAAHVGAVGGQVRAERLEAARRVVEAAHRHEAEFLVVAGDTFEDNAVDRLLVQQVADILGRFSGPVYLIPGNHDPLVPGSVWEHPAWRGHGNLHLLEASEPVRLAGVTLFPCPLKEKYSLKDPTRWIDAKGSAEIAIGIAHGTVEGIAPGEIDYPIARDAATRAGLDYLALGHWHSFASFPAPDGAQRLAYSGTHEATKFGERDSGNAALVEISSRGTAPQLTPIPTGGLGWLVVEETLREPGDLSRLLHQLEAIEGADRKLIDVRLGGVLEPADEPELARLGALLDARFLFSRVETSRLVPSPQDDRWLESMPVGVIRETGRRLQQLCDPAWPEPRPEGATPEVARRALLELYRLSREATR